MKAERVVICIVSYMHGQSPHETWKSCLANSSSDALDHRCNLAIDFRALEILLDRQDQILQLKNLAIDTRFPTSSINAHRLVKRWFCLMIAPLLVLALMMAHLIAENNLNLDVRWGNVLVSQSRTSPAPRGAHVLSANLSFPILNFHHVQLGWCSEQLAHISGAKHFNF